MTPTELELLPLVGSLREGSDYRADLLSPEQERELIVRSQELDFRELEFHGYRGKRRVVSFGYHYDFNDAELPPASPARRRRPRACGSPKNHTP